MAALTTDRATETKEVDPTGDVHPVAGGSKIFAGSIVAVNVLGFALPASDTVDLVVVGLSVEQKDNTAGADGDLTIKVRAPIIARLDASGFTGRREVGQICYVVDDHTVSPLSPGTNAIRAGRVWDVIGWEAGGNPTEAWVLIEKRNGAGITKADADATYGQAEADLINEIKSVLNKKILG